MRDPATQAVRKQAIEPAMKALKGEVKKLVIFSQIEFGIVKFGKISKENIHRTSHGNTHSIFYVGHRQILD